MSQIRVGSHQRFYAFDITPHRCLYQRREFAAGGLGGRRGGWVMVGEDRGRELLVYRVLHVCVCVWESTEKDVYNKEEAE